MFEHRQIILSRSGIIPRLYKLPQAISSLFGKRLHRDGRVNKQEQENVTALRKWYDESHYMVPEGTIMIQSSTAHSWPYPAYLYGKGTWAAVDILYFLPDVPITFMGEIDGDVYKLGSSKVFQTEQAEARGGGLKRTSSQIALALARGESLDESELKNVTHDEKSKGLGVRVRSGSNLAAMVVEQQNSGEQMDQREEEFKKEIGPESGFDLSKIRSHYEHRRALRNEKMVLRYGELAPLLARSDIGT